MEAGDHAPDPQGKPANADLRGHAFRYDESDVGLVALLAKLGSLALRAASPAFTFRRASTTAAARDWLCPTPVAVGRAPDWVIVTPRSVDDSVITFGTAARVLAARPNLAPDSRRWIVTAIWRSRAISRARVPRRGGAAARFVSMLVAERKLRWSMCSVRARRVRFPVR